MNAIWIILIIIIILLIVFFLFSSSSKSQVKRIFGTELVGSQEVPPVTTSASGRLVGQLNGNTFPFELTVTGLSGPPTAAHLHQGPVGANGPIVKDITLVPVQGTPNTWRAVGVWASTDRVQPLTPALIASLQAGFIYVNVHTSQNPNGEIRGQLRPLLQ